LSNKTLILACSPSPHPKLANQTIPPQPASQTAIASAPVKNVNKVNKVNKVPNPNPNRDSGIDNRRKNRA